MLELVDTRWIGERWALAVRADGRPLSMFVWRDRALDPSVRCGDVSAAIVRSVDNDAGACFVELSSGENAFFNLAKSKAPPVEGAHIHIKIKAEAYGDKLANVSPTTEPVSLIGEDAAFSNWLSCLPEPMRQMDELTPAGAFRQISQALESVGESDVTISGGGTIHIDRTRALTAIDVDSAGRIQSSGAPGLNSAALSEAADQICLRRIAGLIIIDLQGAPKGERARKLSDQFAAELTSLLGRKANVLPPSPFGVMQATIARQERPLSEYASATCSPDLRSLETFTEMMRDVLFRAESDLTAFFDLKTSSRLTEYMRALSFDWQSALKDRTGGRVTWTPDAADGLNYRIELL